MGLQPTRIIQPVTHIFPRWTREPAAHNNAVDLCHKKLDALGSLKHVPFDINHLYQFITADCILNATQTTKAAAGLLNRNPKMAASATRWRESYFRDNLQVHHPRCVYVHQKKEMGSV
jgi:hypothetical protein